MSLLAVYWRTLVAIVLLIVLCAFTHSAFDILALAGNTHFYPSLFWLLIALLFGASPFIHRNGLVFWLWGNRLGLESTFWRRLNSRNSVFFAVLSLLAPVVYTSVNHHAWAYYKLFGQPLILLLCPLIYIRKLLNDVAKHS